MALAEIDSLDLGTIFFLRPDIIPVSGIVYAIAYGGGAGDGFVTTTTIDNAGNIGSVIDTLEFDTVYGTVPRIIHISGDIYAIAYRGSTTGSSSDATISVVTVEIDSAGNITDAVIDSLKLAGDGTEYSSPDIVHISGDVYAVVFQGSGRDGFVETLTIETNGAIGAVIDTLEFDTSYGSQPHIIHVSGDIYAVAYVGGTYLSDHDIRIVTIDIDSFGNIGTVVIDSLEIDPRSTPTTQLILGSIIHIAGNTFAIAYQAYSDVPQNKIYIKTLDIGNTGDIGAVIDTLEFENVAWVTDQPRLINLTGRRYAIAYTDVLLNVGILKILVIEANGTIGSITDTLEYDENVSHYQPGMLRITSNILAIAHIADGTVGHLRTIGNPAKKGNPHIDQLIYQHVERI